MYKTFMAVFVKVGRLFNHRGETSKAFPAPLKNWWHRRPIGAGAGQSLRLHFAGLISEIDIRQSQRTFPSFSPFL
jgi:hypothetical protein